MYSIIYRKFALNIFALLATFSAAMMVSIAAQATDTSALSVKGVIRPAACFLTLSNRGIVDFGTIPASDLTDGAYTRLARKDIPIVISCSAGTRIGIKVSDNRADSVVSGIVHAAPDVLVYGLGTVADKKNWRLYAVPSSKQRDNG